MKALIYAGIGLFSVASVYGIADYYQSQKKGTIDRLYSDEDEKLQVVPVNEKKEINPGNKKELSRFVTPVKEISTAKSTKKTRTAKRAIRFEDFSRGRIEKPVTIAEVIEDIPKEVITIKPEEEKIVKPAEEKVAVEPERRISLEQFSRAPLKKKVSKTEKSKIN